MSDVILRALIYACCSPFLVLDLGLDVVGGIRGCWPFDVVGGIHIEGDGFTSESLDEDLCATAPTPRCCSPKDCDHPPSGCRQNPGAVDQAEC